MTHKSEVTVLRAAEIMDSDDEARLIALIASGAVTTMRAPLPEGERCGECVASLADDPAALERSAECAWNASPSFHTLKWYMLGEKEKDTYRAYMTRVLRAAEEDTDVS